VTIQQYETTGVCPGQELEAALRRFSRFGNNLIEKSAQMQPLTTKDQAKLSTIIVEAELDKDPSPGRTIPGNVWKDWVKEIFALFQQDNLF